MIYISVLSFVFLSAGTVLLLDLNAGRVAGDIESLFSPEESLRERALFAQKRKMLYNALEAAYDRNAVRAALAAIGADEKVRAEALSADRLFELYGILGLPSGVTLGGKATPRDGREGSPERTA